MKIGLISTPFLTVPPEGYGGLERIVWDLARGLIDLNQKVVIFATEGSQSPDKGFTIEVCPSCTDTDVNWLEEEQKMWKVYDPILNEADFDIIHGHNWFGFEYATKAQNRELNVCHTHHGWLNTRWWGSSKPDFNLNLMGISDWMVNNYQMLGFSAKRVYNGVDINEYTFSKDHGDRLLFVGRITEFKQPHIAIKAAIDAGYEIDVIGGTFVDQLSYIALIKALGNDRNVSLYLDASHEFKIKKMQQAKALIFPSKMGEPFGLVLVEALACGCPIIALDDGAVKEIISPEVGIICQGGNDQESIRQISQAIKEIDSKPDDCRTRAQLFSKEAMAQNYLDLYNKILIGNEW